MTTPTAGQPAQPTSVNVLAVRRGVLVAVAVIGLLLGLFGLFFPRGALLFVAVVFGVFLVASGIFRIISALLTHNLRVGFRWLNGLLGILIVAAGVICLADPFQSLVVLAYLIGIGWIAAGVTDIMTAVHGGLSRRWLSLLAGIISILAGIVVFVLPATSIVTFELFGSILLIVVSVTALLTMPGKLKLPTA
jgi:uncharacterized membrane protein HdeD (DUF308 family)